MLKRRRREKKVLNVGWSPVFQKPDRDEKKGFIVISYPSIHSSISRVSTPCVSPNSPAAGRGELLRLVPKNPSLRDHHTLLPLIQRCYTHPSHPSCNLSDMQTDTCSDPAKRRSMPKHFHIHIQLLHLLHLLHPFPSRGLHPLHRHTQA